MASIIKFQDHAKGKRELPKVYDLYQLYYFRPENCWLNNINPVNCLEMIFTKIRDGETVTQALLPCYYKEKC